MHQSVRAIVIKDGALLLMKRSKHGQQFYSLVGGGIDDGETPEQAVIREVQEEASLLVANPKLVITFTQAGFGEQGVYLCDYVSGEAALAPDSEEAADTKQGDNSYEPIWYSGDQADINLLPQEFKTLIWGWLKDGFPAEPISFKVGS